MTENPAKSGVFERQLAVTNGKRGEDPMALAETSSGGQPAPNCAGSRPRGYDATQVRSRPPLA
jgi:hypothetical protein